MYDEDLLNEYLKEFFAGIPTNSSDYFLVNQKGELRLNPEMDDLSVWVRKETYSYLHTLPLLVSVVRVYNILNYKKGTIK